MCTNCRKLSCNSVFCSCIIGCIIIFEDMNLFGWFGVHISDICTAERCMTRYSSLGQLWLKYTVTHIKGTAWHRAINVFMYPVDPCTRYR